MSKAQIVETMAADAGISKVAAAAAYDSLVKQVRVAAYKGETFAIPGLANLKVVPTKARKGRNPKTGEDIRIKAGKSARLTPAASLKRVAKKVEKA